MKNIFNNSYPHLNSIEAAAFEAQKIAFSPVTFMTCICMKRLGGWDAFLESLADGITHSKFSKRLGISEYASKVLLESMLAIGAIKIRDADSIKDCDTEDVFYLSKLGHILAKDTMTQVNFDFMYDVCFKGLYHLEDSLKNGKPLGLKELGTWQTIYEGLKDLPEPTKKSWFSFDHFYSDSAFDFAISKMINRTPLKILDIGGNTGRFASKVLSQNTKAQVTIADLPSQILLAKQALDLSTLASRLYFHECNLLEKSAILPKGFDVIWMSQFLVCFSEDQISGIFSKIKSALNEGGSVLILDTFWDLQKTEAAAFCVIQTSPYFTALANGTSKMYDSKTIVHLANSNGLCLVNSWNHIGLSHTLLEFMM